MIKKIKFYSLVSKKNPGVFLTVTCSKKDCTEYSHLLMKLNHLSHFTLWCNYRKYNVEAFSSWLKYFQDCVPKEEASDYAIMRISYRRDNLASILRMFMGSIPLGASFENKLEHSLLNYRINTEVLNEKLIEELINKLDPEALKKFSEDKKDDK